MWQFVDCASFISYKGGEIMKIARIFVAAVAWIGLSAVASASVVIETVHVGDPGNAPDIRYYGAGAVEYEYWIGTYEVTNAQYVEFLNAVAADDTYGVYDPEMWTQEYGCKIERLGGPGAYTYQIAPERANRPVGSITFWRAARFANWLHNGQPTGPQDASTTERGSYRLDGYNGNYGGGIIREANATWFVPSRDEWYKAAYYKGGGTDAGYWDYATQSDTLPSNELIDPDPGNNANYWNDGYTLGPPLCTTVVGEFENSDGAYGTFDMNGNMWEWMDTPVEVYPPYHGRPCLGSAWADHNGATSMHASNNPSPLAPPTSNGYALGFRVGLIPEPATLGLLALGCGLLLKRRPPRPA
jgi:formylglycine-generating enzyme required for sulfatase activity